MRKKDVDLTGAVWRKSTRSGGNGNCVEVATGLPDDHVGVRDSKDKNGAVLIFTADEWDAFIGGAKDSEFER